MVPHPPTHPSAVQKHVLLNPNRRHPNDNFFFFLGSVNIQSKEVRAVSFQNKEMGAVSLHSKEMLFLRIPKKLNKSSIFGFVRFGLGFCLK
jgi:hypothetical protein